MLTLCVSHCATRTFGKPHRPFVRLFVALCSLMVLIFELAHAIVSYMDGDHSGYEYIRDHLGYRLELQQVRNFGRDSTESICSIFL